MSDPRIKINLTIDADEWGHVRIALLAVNAEIQAFGCLSERSVFECAGYRYTCERRDNVALEEGKK
jgi:hypothetical protein